LQLCGNKGVAYVTSLPNTQLMSFIETRLRKEGYALKEMAGAAHYIMSMFESCITDEKLLWILSHQHTHAQNEWSLWLDAREHVIDRSFIDGDTRWVIDYKLAVPSAERPREEFLAHQQFLYEEQLLRYRRAVSAYDKSSNTNVRRVKLALYFPAISYFLHITEFDTDY
jgi:hypothetical protein